VESCCWVGEGEEGVGGEAVDGGGMRVNGVWGKSYWRW
jgi:hypothetical protein